MPSSPSPSEQHTVGIVGLGAMGRPIAEYVLKAGFVTICLDLDDAVVAGLAAQGASPAASPAELAARSSVILVIVPTDEDVLAVCDPEDGLLAGARPGTTLVISSSVRPATCEQVASAARRHGVEVLDAGLTGGVRGAEAGQVNLLVGGDEATLDRVRPVLEPWTRAVHHLGPLGAGQVGKTVNNLVHWAQISAITEALTLGERLGVPGSRLRAALMDGPTDSRTLRELQHMRLTWHAKDLANALAMAASVDQPLPVAETVREVMKATTVDRVAALIADGARGPRPAGALRDRGCRSRPEGRRSGPHATREEASMERDSTKHSPRADEELERETRSLRRGAPVESRAEEERVPEDGDGAIPDEILATAGTEPELPHAQVEARSQLARWLRPSAFPTQREGLLEAARAERAPDSVLTALGRLPATTTFGTVEAVWEALGGHREARF